MIIVQLKGGLGNQMFQYAAAKQLAIAQGSPLKVDLSFLEADAKGYTKRELELDKLEVNIDKASPDEIEQLKRKGWENLFKQTYIKEHKMGLFKTNLKINHSCYLSGYWQNEAFFKDIKNIIRNEFVFKKALNDDYFTDLQTRITTTNSVSIHFRRGDYISNKNANRRLGVCPIDYYQKAISLLSERIETPALFIFSDDIPWVRSHFHTSLPTTFVEKSNESLHSDFRLISMCKHNIIANSSYSWWAAWLNTHKEKIVVAPRIWYKDKRKQRQAKDRVPKEWWRI